MSWDSHWEDVFRKRDWGKYPPEELVRFVARNFFAVSDRNAVKILELGCGPGANLWFLAREGFDTFGIDGSVTAVQKANERLAREGLAAHLQLGDVIDVNAYYPVSSFDAVIDVCCLECNRIKDVARTLQSVKSLLVPGGKFFSMMVAEGSFGQQHGTEVEPGTFVDFMEGPMQGKGLCHFFSLGEVEQLFEGFASLQIEYSTRTLNSRECCYKHWVVEAATAL